MSDLILLPGASAKGPSVAARPLHCSMASESSAPPLSAQRSELLDGLMQLQPYAGVGVAGIIAGGLCAAVTGPLDWHRGSWVAAFLVLVVGVGQLCLALGEHSLLDRRRFAQRSHLQLALFNGGSLGVVVGTLLAEPVIVSLASLVVMTSLIRFALASREVNSSWSAAKAIYVGMLALLIVSTPVGIALSWLRA